MDVERLLSLLIRFRSGEKKVWSIVRVPSVEQEDRRHLHRERLALRKDRTRHINRIKGLLAGHGIRLEARGEFLMRLDEVRQWDGAVLPAGLKARLRREYERLLKAQEQIQELEKERVEAIRHSEEPSVGVVRNLLKLNGIGLNSASLYGMEFFAWRGFRNRKEVGGLSGLTPTPYQSSGSNREQGTLAPALQVQVSARPAIGISGPHLHCAARSALQVWRLRSRGGGSGTSWRAS